MREHHTRHTRLRYRLYRRRLLARAKHQNSHSTRRRGITVASTPPSSFPSSSPCALSFRMFVFVLRIQQAAEKCNLFYFVCQKPFAINTIYTVYISQRVAALALACTREHLCFVSGFWTVSEARAPTTRITAITPPAAQPCVCVCVCVFCACRITVYTMVYNCV